MLKTDPLNQIKPTSANNRFYKYLLTFLSLVEARVNKIRGRFIGARANAIPCYCCAIIPRHDNSHNVHLFGPVVSCFSESSSDPQAAKRAYDPWSLWPEEEIARERTGVAKAWKTSLPQQWRMPVLKRSSEDLSSLSHLPATSGCRGSTLRPTTNTWRA